MTNKMELRSFHLLEYLKKRFSDGFNRPFFLATHETFKQAAIDFPLRSFFYGIGLTYSGNCFCNIGAQEYQLKKNSLITVGPGIVS